MAKIPENERAVMAFEHIQQIKDKDEATQKKYRSIALKLPAIIHMAGLAPGLHFVQARMDKSQSLILDHLAKQLKLQDRDALLDKVRKAEFDETSALTMQIQRCLQWYKRFSQVELKSEEEE